MSKKAVAITIILLFIVIGFGYSVYGMYSAAKSLQIETEVDNFELEGFNPPLDPIPDAITITFRILIRNPSDFSLEVERVNYNVYVENKFFGGGYKENIYVPAKSTTPVYIDFTTRTSDLLNVIADLVSRGDTAIDYDIKAIATVPIKFFNTIRVFNIDAPIEKSDVYLLNIPIGKPQASFVKVYWSPEIVIMGYNSSATLYIEITKPISGELTIVIMKDIPLMPDQEVKRIDYGYFQGPTTITYVFTPPEPSSLTLRGYYAIIYIDGKKVFEQPDGYPPRLKVTK